MVTSVRNSARNCCGPNQVTLTHSRKQGQATATRIVLRQNKDHLNCAGGECRVYCTTHRPFQAFGFSTTASGAVCRLYSRESIIMHTHTVQRGRVQSCLFII